MALPTALSLFVLSLGILGTFPSLGWRAPFEMRPVALNVLTTLLPLALIAPLLFGAVIVFGAHTDFYSFGFVPSFFALATATLAVALSLFAANVVRIAEGRLIEMETALRESNKRKDEFLASLAHELRNPLASFRGGVNVLRKLDPEPPEAKKVLPIMERQVEHLIRLVDDLLDVSRITRGKIHLRKRRCNLIDILRGAIDMSEPQIRARGHHLTAYFPPSPIMLEADAARLTQVFCNLLDNAAKYTEAGGQIWMKAQHCDCEAIVSVRDSGKGIPATLLPHIFELFTQGAEEFGRSDSGLGVGLALVFSFVHEHGGSIDVHSAGSDQGSEFIVRLPLNGEIEHQARRLR